MRRIHSTIIGLGVFGAGAILGPLLIVAANASLTRQDDVTRTESIYRMIEAAQQRAAHERLRLTIMVDHSPVEACGYDSTILPGAPDALRYDILARAQAEAREATRKERLAESLAPRMSSFEVSFLAGCTQKTVFAGACHRIVDGLLREASAASSRSSVRKDYHVEDAEAAMCTYLDGLAARKGIPLAERRGKAPGR